MADRFTLINTEILNEDTGEIIDIKDSKDLTIIIGKRGGRYIGPKQAEFLKQRSLRYADNTPFVWANFKYNKPFHPDIEDANIPKMIFLATFCNNVGYVMGKQDITDMLNISYNLSKKFRDNLTEQKVLFFKRDLAFISPRSFYKGKLKDTGTSYIRIYEEYNQKLYQSCTTTQHKQLSYVYRMIPYLNRQTNILSYNQQEQEIKHIVNMSVKDFCRKVGYKPSHSARLRNCLSQFRVNGELAVGFFNDLTQLIPDGKYIVVNPNLFYGGEKTTNNYKQISKLFKEEKNRHLGN